MFVPVIPLRMNSDHRAVQLGCTRFYSSWPLSATCNIILHGAWLNGKVSEKLPAEKCSHLWWAVTCHRTAQFFGPKLLKSSSVFSENKVLCYKLYAVWCQFKFPRYYYQHSIGRHFFKDLLRYLLAREGVSAPGRPLCLAHAMQKVSNIVGLTAIRLAFLMVYG